jgi:hypothetical protein
VSEEEDDDAAPSFVSPARSTATLLRAVASYVRTYVRAWTSTYGTPGWVAGARRTNAGHPSLDRALRDS